MQQVCYLHAAKVAVLSAKEHSPNLIPVLLYGGSSGEASAAAHDNILWYREQGGIVYHHNLTFMSDLQASELATRHAHHNIGPGHNQGLQPPYYPSKHAYTLPFEDRCPSANSMSYTASNSLVGTR